MASVKTVLVVDDDPDLLHLVAIVLGQDGYQVEMAADGCAGLEIVAQRLPDLILLDLQMPLMDGGEFARRFHARYDGRTPIVIFTASADARRRAEEIGAAGWVAKPFDLEVLLAAVRRHVGRA